MFVVQYLSGTKNQERSLSWGTEDLFKSIFLLFIPFIVFYNLYIFYNYLFRFIQIKSSQLKFRNKLEADKGQQNSKEVGFGVGLGSFVAT